MVHFCSRDGSDGVVWISVPFKVLCVNSVAVYRKINWYVAQGKERSICTS